MNSKIEGVVESLKSMRDLAAKEKADLLAYLIEMALIEAQEIVRRSQPRAVRKS